jgi:poly-gamma-glutamate synthesis protein (capsule biosynthesis protein)
MTSAHDTPKYPRGSRLVVTVLAVLLVAGCRPGLPAPIVIAPPVAALTPFQPSIATPTSPVVRIWISPSVPPALRAAFEEDVQRSGMKVEWAGRPDSASVQLRLSSSRPYALWTYAVVSAFPTLEDGLTWDALAARWKGTVVDGGPVWAMPDVQALLEDVLGPPAASAVGQSSDESLLDEVWASRPGLAVIPFEDLQPKWKVLEIDGISPVRKDFDGEGYPLQISFGLEGDSAAIERLSQSMDLPTGPAQTNRKAEKLTIVVVTGVTALTRATAWRMEVRGVEYPAQLIGDWLRQADITHVSNEVAFSPNCPAPTPDLTLLTFCSQPSHIALLDDVGTDVIELTGNHVLDAGAPAFLYSMDLYDERGWKTFGGGRDLASASAPALFEHNGNRLAFLGCNEAGPTSAWATAAGPGALSCGEDRLRAEIVRLRDAGYLPIFTFQWHEHYIPWPAASQREAFRAAADAGAVIVSGSQAHQPQGFEFRGDSFIHYGPGNLFFDQMWSVAVRQEFIDRYVFYDGRLLSIELLTAMLEDWAQPRPMTLDERADFLQAMFTASGW